MEEKKCVKKMSKEDVKGAQKAEHGKKEEEEEE